MLKLFLIPKPFNIFSFAFFQLFTAIRRIKTVLKQQISGVCYPIGNYVTCKQFHFLPDQVVGYFKLAGAEMIGISITDYLIE